MENCLLYCFHQILLQLSLVFKRKIIILYSKHIDIIFNHVLNINALIRGLLFFSTNRDAFFY